MGNLGFWAAPRGCTWTGGSPVICHAKAGVGTSNLRSDCKQHPRSISARQGVAAREWNEKRRAEEGAARRVLQTLHCCQAPGKLAHENCVI